MNENLEINIIDILEKMKIKVAEDAQKIAMLEVTVDMYVSKIEELYRQIEMLKEMQNQ